jgi:hypothetical protein
LYSLSGLPGASLACRRFGIHRPYFYRRKALYDKQRLSSLENRSARPEPTPVLLHTGACRESKADKKRRSSLPGKKDTPYSAENGERCSQRFNNREADKQGKPVFQG